MKDIHEYSKRLEQAMTRVRNSTAIAAHDKTLIERFSMLFERRAFRQAELKSTSTTSRQSLRCYLS